MVTIARTEGGVDLGLLDPYLSKGCPGIQRISVNSYEGFDSEIFPDFPWMNRVLRDLRRRSLRQTTPLWRVSLAPLRRDGNSLSRLGAYIYIYIVIVIAIYT